MLTKAEEHIIRYTRDLMKRNGMQGWYIGFDRAVKRLGRTTYNKREITFSRKYVEILPVEEMELVAIHEVAHALAGPMAKHGPGWKKICKELGGDTRRCADTSAQPELAWKGICAKGHIVTRQRTPQRIMSCAKCQGNSRVFNPDHLIMWKKNGVTIPLSEMPVKYQKDIAYLRDIGYTLEEIA